MHKFSGSIIVLKIENELDMRHFKQIRTDYPDNYFICLISNKKRKIIFDILSRFSLYLLFLPLVEEEIIKTLQRIFQEMENLTAKIDFYHGLSSFKQAYSWKTQEINISNTAKFISNLLRHINLYKNDFEEVNARLGIEEALINAVEHGNLELDSKDRLKSSVKEDHYEELKKNRFNDIQYNQKLIRIELELKNKAFYITIEDEGQGFDTTRAKAIFAGKAGINDSEITNPMGKGFWIIKNLFNSVKFEKDGRKIILEKKIS